MNKIRQVIENNFIKSVFSNFPSKTLSMFRHLIQGGKEPTDLFGGETVHTVVRVGGGQCFSEYVVYRELNATENLNCNFNCCGEFNSSQKLKNCCEKILNWIPALATFFISDKAISIHPSRAVNKQNCCHWAANNLINNFIKDKFILQK